LETLMAGGTPAREMVMIKPKPAAQREPG